MKKQKIEKIPQIYDPSKELDSGWMDYDEYQNLPECFVQRDTESRLKKAQKHLSKIMVEHCVVFLARLTKDDEVEGEPYKAGYICRLDSNTRALNWKVGGSDKIPSKVFTITYNFDSMSRMKTSYNTFDSADALERTNEKLYGILTGMYGYNPISEKLKKGQIVTGLSQACQLYFPDEFNSNDTKSAVLAGMVGVYLEEIKALDKIIKNSEMWNQSWISAALLMLKHFGTEDKRLLKGLDGMDFGHCIIDRTSIRDGITHITNEWKVNSFLGEAKGTALQQIRPCINFVCYWLDKYMADKKGSKVGNNWDSFATNLRNNSTLFARFDRKQSSKN